MEWAQFGMLAGLIVTGFGYLTRLIHREVDGLEVRLTARLDHIEARLDRLEERYVRHLEQHAAG